MHWRRSFAYDPELVTVTCVDCHATGSVPRCTELATSTGEQCRAHARDGTATCRGHDPERMAAAAQARTERAEDIAANRCTSTTSTGARCTSGAVRAGTTGLCVFHGGLYVAHGGDAT